MKKSLIWFALSSTFALLWVASSDAAWFGRCHRRTTCQPCPPVVCPVACPTAVPEVMQLVSPKGRSYRITDTGERGEFFEPKRLPTTTSGTTPSIDDFDGTDRAAAKTSIAVAPIEKFANVKKLLDSLPKDETMLELNISKAASSNRVEQEKRNVSVHGFIYAVKFEDDHDYHVILGMGPDAGQEAYLNVEVSGLPKGGAARAPLKAARTEFQTFFAAHHTKFGSSYKKFDPPIPVKLEGSLFFDADHKAGVVGPTGMRPKTAWEIHPVTKIEFEIDP